jgi:hypothetical protein
MKHVNLVECEPANVRRFRSEPMTPAQSISNNRSARMLVNQGFCLRQMQKISPRNIREKTPQPIRCGVEEIIGKTEEPGTITDKIR